MKHPLLNPSSTHYQIDGEKPAIQILEEALTLKEAIGFAKGNIIKYEYRLEHKGQAESDKEKLKTYKDYLAFLENLYYHTPNIRYGYVKDCYDDIGLEMDYTI